MGTYYWLTKLQWISSLNYPFLGDMMPESRSLTPARGRAPGAKLGDTLP